MKSKTYFLFMCFLFFHSTYPFSYDSVIYTAQNGDIKAADHQMRSIVVNAPDDPDVLYDAGVLAYQLHNHSQAAAYFNRSAQCAHNNKDLCFRAHFNAGNAHVDNKNLEQALEHYKQALVIDPDNEYARHNHDRVTQMLQQQEQQKNDEQKKDKQQDQKDDKDQQDKDEQNQDDQSGDSNDQQKNDNNKDQQQEDNQQQSNDSQKNGSDQPSDQKSKGKQGKSSDQDSKRKQGTEQGNKDKDQHDSANDKERNGEQEFDKQSERAQNEREKQQSKQHEKTPQEQNKKQDKPQSENSIPSQDKQEQYENSSIDALSDDASNEALAKSDLDPWLQGILNDQELHDKAVNKKLMEARIRQHGGKNGQNCW